MYISKKEKAGMPSGNAGLVRYFDDYKEAVQIKPEHILGFISFIIVLELVLKYMAV
ncbi:MAG: preprotein translocase subunit Sec61beta [DPANN group archaeon]|nr:preprotein translocase subunit Sec61beta [DPANN group archaeon]